MKSPKITSQIIYSIFSFPHVFISLLSDIKIDDFFLWFPTQKWFIFECKQFCCTFSECVKSNSIKSSGCRLLLRADAKNKAFSRVSTSWPWQSSEFPLSRANNAVASTISVLVINIIICSANWYAFVWRRRSRILCVLTWLLVINNSSQFQLMAGLTMPTCALLVKAFARIFSTYFYNHRAADVPNRRPLKWLHSGFGLGLKIKYKCWTGFQLVPDPPN